MTTKMYRRQWGCRDMWVSSSQLGSRPGQVTHIAASDHPDSVSVTEATASCLLLGLGVRSEPGGGARAAGPWLHPPEFRDWPWILKFALPPVCSLSLENSLNNNVSASTRVCHKYEKLSSLGRRNV